MITSNIYAFRYPGLGFSQWLPFSGFRVGTRTGFRVWTSKMSGFPGLPTPLSSPQNSSDWIVPEDGPQPRQTVKKPKTYEFESGLWVWTLKFVRERTWGGGMERFPLTGPRVNILAKNPYFFPNRNFRNVYFFPIFRGLFGSITRRVVFNACNVMIYMNNWRVSAKFFNILNKFLHKMA